MTVADDPALASLSSTMIPSISFGMLYKNTNGLNLGFSIPKLVNSQNLDTKYSFSYSDQLVVSASFSKWNPNPKFVKGKSTKSYGKPKKIPSVPLEVYGLYRYSAVFGSLFEATARYNFNKSVWLSGSYRQYQGLIPGVGFNVDNLSLSYFYEIGLGGDLPLRTHEVLLSLKIGKEKKFRGIPPAPTQITKTSPPKQPTVIAKVPEKKPPQQPVIKKTDTPVVKKDNVTQPVVSTNTNPPVKKDNVTQPVISTNTTPQVIKKDNPTTTPVTPDLKKDSTRHKPRYEQKLPQMDIEPVNEEHEAERKELDKHIEEHGEGKHDDTHNEPINERHDFVKRGNHHEEMELGTYVISGAFQSRANAEHYTNTLKAMGYKSSDFGHLSARNLWYVFIAQENQVDDAKKERDRLQKNKIFSKVWLLTVQE